MKELGDAEQTEALISQQNEPSHGSKDSWSRLSGYVRIVFEVSMILALCVLVAHHIAGVNNTNGPVPRFPTKAVTFIPNDRYLDDQMFFDERATLNKLHSWLDMSSEAQGYVSVPDWSSYEQMQKPYNVRLDRVTEGPGYMMSVFHQLHCLSYLVQHFQKGFSGVRLSHDVAHHSAHCFDYLRQNIMCSGDTSLEGNTTYGPGWGSVHQCIDYGALLDWANKNGAQKRRGTMPDATL